MKAKQSGYVVEKRMKYRGKTRTMHYTWKKDWSIYPGFARVYFTKKAAENVAKKVSGTIRFCPFVM
jgi:hypothetical protein